jgi:nucleotide-binding universal stress UspA family protein
VTVLVGFVPTPREGLPSPPASRRSPGARRGWWCSTRRAGAPVSADVARPELVEQLSAEAADAGVTVDIRQAPHAGDAADEVLRVADEVDASVIVIGLRRRSPVGKLLMGSSAQRILLDAHRPVLAVKSPSSGR